MDWQSKMFERKLSKKEICEIIDSEPNYPGSMPWKNWFRTLWFLFTNPARIYRDTVLLCQIKLKMRMIDAAMNPVENGEYEIRIFPASAFPGSCSNAQGFQGQSNQQP